MTTALCILGAILAVAFFVGTWPREDTRDMLRRRDPLNPDYRLDRVRDRNRWHREP